MPHRLNGDCRLHAGQLLARSGLGLAGLRRASLATLPHFAAGKRHCRLPSMPKAPPLPGKAKRVIHLFMNGGPSHVDTFDPKPRAKKYAGKPLPTPNLPTERKTGAAFPSPFKFQKYGQSGIEVSELFSARRANASTTSASFARCTPTCPITSRR